MKFEDQHLDSQMEQLFHSARTQAPKYAYSDTSKTLLSGLALGATSVAHAKLVSSSLFKSKLIVMSVSTIIVATSAVLIYSNSNKPQAANEKKQNPLKTHIFLAQNPLSDEKVASTEDVYFSKFSREIASEPMEISSTSEIPLPVLKIEEAKSVNESEENSKIHLVKFTITERTTLEEFNQIKEKAKEAGLAFSHSVKMRNNAIRTLNITLRDVNGKLVNRVTAGKSLRQTPFSIDLSWSVDEFGKFVGFNEFDKDYTENTNDFMEDSAKLNAQMQRELALMDLMELEWKSFDSLNEITNKYLEIINAKNELFLENSNEQNKLYKKLNRLESRNMGNRGSKQKTAQELSTLNSEIEDYETILKQLESEMNVVEEQMRVQDAVLEKHLAKMDYLDVLLQNPDQAIAFSDSKLDVLDPLLKRNLIDPMIPKSMTHEKEQNLKRINHVVSNLTTLSDLEEIQKLALNAGIVFSYEAQVKKDKLVRININMHIVKEDGKKIHAQIFRVSKKGEAFSYPLSWRENEKGEAVDFGDANAMREF